MKQQALGMIETLGLVAAIEAADVATKTAAVKLIGYEKVTGGLVMVAVSGEVAAVQAAVTAGAAAAQRVGRLVSQHVIPRPLVDVALLIKKSAPEQGREEPGQDKADGVLPAVQNANSRDHGEVNPSTPAEQQQFTAEYLESLTVVELRRLARKVPGLDIQGRQISRANKEQLVSQILQARDRK